MATVIALLVTAGSVTALSGATADGNNALIGPIFGLQFGQHAPNGGVLGVEAGVGWGAERLNLGSTYRAGEFFSYVELDPWLYLGASLGVGYGSETGVHGIYGLWEGVPLAGIEGCGGIRTVATLSVGYRYTGVHELYLAPKVGKMDGGICLH